MVRLYHGTSDKFLQSIRTLGIQPRSFTGVSNYKRELSVPNWVYFSTNPDDAQNYAARTAQNRGGQPIVVVVDVPEESLVPDEDFLRPFPFASITGRERAKLSKMSASEARRHMQNKFNEWQNPILYAAIGTKYKKYIGRELDVTRASAEFHETVAHVGTVSPETIVEVREVSGLSLKSRVRFADLPPPPQREPVVRVRGHRRTFLY